ncbi:hypothetical protein P154DRAFT_479352 [Amniculicola lignicola CBS 123094]|uniref:polynucleotide adenylyltransferase n=1 Tax=Amniculicola lignicola CBS 123094 TaxID=1392246 RepID=A0A6A5X503_9PLEO|nr:hypothetical protein P154DRAFT_479352 [Amniculicola lignicola CBS 123094]
MAPIEDSVDSGHVSLSSHDTALCVIPPQDQCHSVDQLRSLYDKGHGKWPPHVNLLYPFVAPEKLLQTKTLLQDKLQQAMQGHQGNKQDVRLKQAGFFPHRRNNTIYLCEEGSISSALEFFRSAVLKALGHEPTPCSFHLTIGQSEDRTISSREFLLSKARLLPSMEFPVHSLAILVRELVGDSKTQSRMRLWGTIEIESDEQSTSPPLTEFWLQKTDGRSNNPEDEGISESAVAPFSRQIEPGTTFHFQTNSGLWISGHPTEESEPLPEEIGISSYNVLIDSEYPPSRDRDPLLLEAILSQKGVADILVLQEVSDDFLSYLLGDSRVQELYPFTSHGPPSQEDLGPLPNLRNVVVLSKWNFSWEFVPFHRRHKGAVVAKFDAISKNAGSTALPLIVAGVHLTCGLTDGSVAAKKVQLLNLKNHLSRRYASNPWIIAGDFNITTSSQTINTALKNKSISAQTTNTLEEMEAIFPDTGLLDAWSVSRVAGTDEPRVGSHDDDDLFEGEQGSTFNPRENTLAAATSGTSNNRPQRYDRILTRPQGVFRIAKFNYFGVLENDSTQFSVPSDHWGIRTSMKMLADPTEASTGRTEMLESYSVQAMHTSGALTDNSALTNALLCHDMFPTDEEVQARKDAFALVERVVLGADGENSDIPMVIVPVGSYSLGVWTSASDIDCLCIGAISSKTFFKLARQRIHRAGAQGVRLLRKVDANTGTMFELSVNGISMDLQYCPAARVVEKWAEFPTLSPSDPIFNLSILSLRKLKPYRDTLYIQRTLPSISTFRLAYRCIKLWAVQHGIYSSKFGFLGGIHLTLMLSWVCKRMAYDNATFSATDLVATFFHHYANFEWENGMIFDVFFHNNIPRYHRSSQEPMVVLGYHTPNSNVAHTSSVPALNTLIKEMKNADQRLSQRGMTWEKFFGVLPPMVNAPMLSPGVTDFLTSHENYAKITIQYWGRSLSKGKGLVGWVESRCVNLVVDIHRSVPDVHVRVWPARFTNKQNRDWEAGIDDYQGCYLIGLSKTEGAVSNPTKEDKILAKQALQKAFQKFLDQLQSDEKHHDPSSCWTDIELVKPSDIKDLQLDDREWGNYIPDAEPDSDDEEDMPEEEDLPLPTANPHTAVKLPHRPLSSPVSTTKLRPASDILNRLRWDPALSPGDYIVGYEDRFLGVKETSLERWKTEQTDDEFIPQHRIMYFKRRGDGVVVWERKTRIDKIFGSGIGNGKA